MRQMLRMAGAAALLYLGAGSLAACVYAPPPPVAYGYPGYAAYPAYYYPYPPVFGGAVVVRGFR